MAGYKNVDSSLPDRIMKMAEAEQHNQHQYRENILDKYSLLDKRDFIYDIVSLCFCTLLCLVFIVLAAILFIKDKTGALTFFSVSAFIVLPKTFLVTRARKKEEKSLDKKN